MKISRTWLQKYFVDELPDSQKLAELFTFNAFEVEEVDGDILDIKVLPDRNHYALSHRGIAEEVNMISGLKLVENQKDKIEVADEVPKVEVEIHNKEKCRRYMARRIENIDMNVESGFLQWESLLISIGARSINPVVDATNYTMFDVGQPLHAFDADKVKGKIVIRDAKKDEKVILLDEREVLLDEDDLVIADDESVLAIAGVKGGKRAEVTHKTQNIILESANFEPVTIRRTSTKYNLRNESSKRFENEITELFSEDGMEAVTARIKSFSPVSKIGPITDVYATSFTMGVIVITTDFITKKLGIHIEKEEIKNILTRLSIKIDENNDELTLTIPPHRLDLKIKEDIVEEVGRLYGYEKIQGNKNLKVSQASVNPNFYKTEKIKNTLINMGFSEVYLYTFTSTGEIEVAYPLASDKKALRTNLSEGLEKSLNQNARNGDLLFLDSIKIFEIGKVFTNDGEHTSLCIGIKRLKKEKGKSLTEDIKLLREELFGKLDLNLQTVCTIDDSGGVIIMNGKPIGEINKHEGIMEINLDKLIEGMEIPKYEELGFKPAPKVVYHPYSQFPFIVRDIAVFVPENVTPDEISSLFVGENILKYKLFDEFKKEGKISYAFRIIFQSFERTLTDDEVSNTIGVIVKKVAEKGWEVR